MTHPVRQAITADAIGRALILASVMTGEFNHVARHADRVLAGSLHLHAQWLAHDALQRIYQPVLNLRGHGSITFSLGEALGCYADENWPLHRQRARLYYSELTALVVANRVIAAEARARRLETVVGLGSRT